MRLDIVETKVYEFSELSETAQQAAIDTAREFACEDSFWHESVIEDAKEAASMIGIEVEDIFFSGFCSQGDGAQFTGTYSYAKDSAKRIKAEWPLDKDLHDIVEGLRDLQRRNFYALQASVSSRGHYSHALCTEITVYDTRDYYLNVLTDNEETLSELLRDFMHWIYKRLETEYEYQISDETLREWLADGDQEYTESGGLY